MLLVPHLCVPLTAVLLCRWGVPWRPSFAAFGILVLSLPASTAAPCLSRSGGPAFHAKPSATGSSCSHQGVQAQAGGFLRSLRASGIPDQAEQAVRLGEVEVGGARLLIQPWRDTAPSRPSNWFYHCKIFIERLPLYAWCEEGIRQALGDCCCLDYIDPVSFTQENTEFLQCWVWMWNPDQLPRSKLGFRSSAVARIDCFLQSLHLHRSTAIQQRAG